MRIYLSMALLGIVALLVIACGGAATAVPPTNTPAPAPTAAPTQAPAYGSAHRHHGPASHGRTGTDGRRLQP